MKKKRKKEVRVILAVGGTGGHIFPAQQLAKKLQKRKIPCLFAGYKLSHNDFLQKESFPYREIASGSLRSLHKILKGLWQSITLFKDFRPTVVIGFGSYHTVPLLLASKIFRCKLFLFEANVTVGRANDLFSHFSTALCMQFPPVEKVTKKPVVVKRLPWDDRKLSSLPKKKERNILIFGGSQGAKIFNEFLPSVLKQVRGKVTITHIAGKKDSEVRRKYEEIGLSATVLSFSHEMDRLYQQADMVIARSGASTIAELLHYEIPSILIPYPFATKQHQEKNALFLEKLGGCFHIPQLLLTEELLLKRIVEVCGKKSDEMKRAMQQYKKKSEEKDFVELIIGE